MTQSKKRQMQYALSNSMINQTLTIDLLVTDGDLHKIQPDQNLNFKKGNILCVWNIVLDSVMQIYKKSV